MSQSLSERDRRFFTLVSEAAFANPFGARRAQLDAEIGEQPASEPGWEARVLATLATRLRGLSRHGKLELRAFSAEARELVEHSVLFELFHRFAPALDRLIARQGEAQKEPLRVDFAGDFLRELSSRGLPPERAERVLELFYQMRRAFFFISPGLSGRSRSMGALREQL